MKPEIEAKMRGLLEEKGVETSDILLNLIEIVEYYPSDIDSITIKAGQKRNTVRTLLRNDKIFQKRGNEYYLAKDFDTAFWLALSA